jgi:hypothetical protein
MYNREVPLDYRRLIGWARDVSAVSESEYEALQRPREISSFPDDLALARTLEFTGSYEDGWLSSHAKFVLAGSGGGNFVRMRSVIPEVKGTALGSGKVAVAINGVHICDVPAPLGTNDWLIPVPASAPKTAVELKFSASAVLPSPDERSVGAHLEYLGIVDAADTVECDYASASTPRFAAVGIDRDGWAESEAQVFLPPSNTATDVVLRLEYPDWAAQKATRLTAALADSDVRQVIDLAPASRPTLSIRLPASSRVRVLELGVPTKFSLPAPDHRERAVRVLAITTKRATQP